MISLDVIEKLVNLVPISREDIFNLLQIEDNVTIEIYGNYKSFAVDQISEDTLFYKIIRFTNGLREYKKEHKDYDKKSKFKQSSWVIVCKKGYIKYTLERIKYFFEYFGKRSDLNILTRIKMSLLKTKRWVGRTVYYIDIDTFSICPAMINSKIKRLFDTGEIDRIYIYKTQDKFLLQQLYVDEHYKNKYKRPY